MFDFANDVHTVGGESSMSSSWMCYCWCVVCVCAYAYIPVQSINGHINISSHKFPSRGAQGIRLIAIMILLELLNFLKTSWNLTLWRFSSPSSLPTEFPRSKRRCKDFIYGTGKPHLAHANCFWLCAYQAWVFILEGAWSVGEGLPCALSKTKADVH